MIVDSKIAGGFAHGGAVLLQKGLNTLDGKRLTASEKEFIKALVIGKLATIIEEDPPGEVIPFPVVKREPMQVKKPMKRRVAVKPTKRKRTG